jgi:hypothetical protein
MLSSDWVADGEAGAIVLVTLGEDEEAVAEGLRTVGVVKPGDRVELGVDGPVIKGVEVFVEGTAVLGTGDELTPDDRE